MRGQKIKLGEPYHGLNHTDRIMANPHPWHFMGPAKLRAAQFHEIEFFKILPKMEEKVVRIHEGQSNGT